MNKSISALGRFIGFGSNKTSHREKVISGVGGFVGILVVLVVTGRFVAASDAGLIVASMGASAVLVFAVPHGPLSQPWALGAGQFVSAVIGVSCYQWIPNLFVAAAVAVGLAIVAMYYLRCIHPPGGATALTAVVAGSGVHALGYMYVITPVLINVAVIFGVAVVFNFLFPWRRYPAAIMQYGGATTAPQAPTEHTLRREDLEYAMRQMNLYVDASDEDLERIYALAKSRTDRRLTAAQITLGHYYSNGEYGGNWAVRQVVDGPDNPRPGRDLIIYKVVAGEGRRSSGACYRDEFARWAKYEVYLNENSWQRIAPIENQIVSVEQELEPIDERTSPARITS